MQTALSAAEHAHAKLQWNTGYTHLYSNPMAGFGATGGSFGSVDKVVLNHRVLFRAEKSVKTINDDENWHEHCPSQYLQLWKCIGKHVSSSCLVALTLFHLLIIEPTTYVYLSSFQLQFSIMRLLHVT
jgi:hypothetical protein